ncbi:MULTISPECIES: preprotein translocase subunit YajC [Sporomusa]|jgi:preprotein translocase subunit YajC|uniref:Preprotein translocase, YajC subunit n=1 Tax=uncultured Sporomusa sp. TaxID=307249 RepID=A0A212LRK2_9FIRM|nr:MULTISPECIES: preprotein translocase subunit YajC [Sporomusa]MCM0757265.1 preprotein translocase subunit YajC [Sporomusa sphaeroides DSM 2875]SCM80188.1 Preprotein translocase, YajC subunit [uncultured Sporomusa sp.]HML34276.1 preprotein translocase subunit YajC [Sporomusa sphaeroides]
MTPEIMQAIQASWPIVLMGVIFYFLLYRPQKKEQQRRKELLDNLKKGARVVTIGGIYGTITALSEKTVTIKIADKVEVEISRTAVGQLQSQPKE